MGQEEGVNVMSGVNEFHSWLLDEKLGPQRDDVKSEAPECRHTPYLEADMEMLRQVLLTTEYVSSQNTEAWIQDLECGDEQSIIATLMVRLTNVRTLELERIGGGIHEPQRFFDALMFISAAETRAPFPGLSTSTFFILGRHHEKSLW